MFQRLSNCTFYRFDSFGHSEKLLQAMATRIGGVSEGEYRSLNLGFHVGDENDAVLINRQRLCQALSIPLESIVTGQQVHGAEVTVVREGDRGRGAHSWWEALRYEEESRRDCPWELAGDPGYDWTKYGAEDDRGIRMRPGEHKGWNKPVDRSLLL
jgi:hypothetical protein